MRPCFPRRLTMSQLPENRATLPKATDPDAFRLCQNPLRAQLLRFAGVHACPTLQASSGVIARKTGLGDFQPSSPGVHNFALLSAFEATARASLISIFPVLMYRSLGDAKVVSEVYLGIGLLSMVFALLTPMIGRVVPRRWLYSFASLTMLFGIIVGGFGDISLIPLAVALNAIALIILTVCHSAYLMDYIERTSMGRNETLRLLYSGLPWTVGPYLGVWLMDRQPLAPFILAGSASLCQLGYFWYLRMGDGKAIARALRPPVNPVAYMPRFFRQPLLLAGWFFAAIRSAGWNIYIVYVPIFAIEAGMTEQIGGLTLSISNAFLFVTPLMLRMLTHAGVRLMIAGGFVFSGLLFVVAMFAAPVPYLAILLLLAATFFLVSLDVTAGLPFLMSVKPSERAEMAAIYATFRDVSGVISPAMARAVLVFAPLPAVFGVCGLSLLACGLLARKLHPRLGHKRLQAD